MSKSIFTSKRFLPLFLTQFWGAFNDNFFKNALVILITYRAYTLGALDSKMMVAVASALFILPFFLFSATAGQLADKYSKSEIAKWTKVWEIGAMILGAVALSLQNIPLLLLTLFLMGMQSSFFGPVKYGILPELLERQELVGGNAFVEMGTFISILIGTICGGVLISLPQIGEMAVGATIICIAIIGTIFSWYIPKQTAQDPTLKIDWNLFTATSTILKKAKTDRSIWLSIMGISWFWAVGSLFITLIPLYGRDILKLHPLTSTLLLAIFSVGIGVGSVLCEKLSHQRLEVGILPFGTVGMSLAAYDLYRMGNPFLPLDAASTWIEFFSRDYAWRVCFDLFILSSFGGLFIVPLYTLIQMRAKVIERAQVIAANNIVNSFFMVIAAIGLMAFFTLKKPMVDAFLWISLINLLIAFIIYLFLPEFFYRFVCYLLTSAMYRVKLRGEKSIPLEGPCIMVANHISFVDWMLLLAISPRPIRFVMHRQYYRIPFLNSIFKQSKLIEIAGPFEDRKTFLRSFDDIDQSLDAGDLVCIFPEGEISYDGKLGLFKRGIDKILEVNDVPVIPVAISGMWGSFFSRQKGKVPFSRIWSKIEIEVGSPFSRPTSAELRDWIKEHMKDEVR